MTDGTMCTRHGVRVGGRRSTQSEQRVSLEQIIQPQIWSFQNHHPHPHHHESQPQQSHHHFRETTHTRCWHYTPLVPITTRMTMLSTPPRPGSSPPTTTTATPPRTYTFVPGSLLERVARNDPCCTMAHVSSSSSGGPSCLQHEGAQQWAYAVSHNTKLVVLGLTQTHLPPGDSAAWQALAKALAQHPRLEYLTLKYNPQLGSLGLSVLAQALCRSTTSSRLRVLNVAHCQVGDEACVDLAAWLSLSQCRLERLDVQHNDIGPVGLTALAHALPTCTTLQRVELQGNTRLETAQHVHVQEPCTYRRRCPNSAAPKKEPPTTTATTAASISIPPPPWLSIPPPLPHSHGRSTSIQSVSSSTSSEASTGTTCSSSSSRPRVHHHSSPMCRAWQALDQALSSEHNNNNDTTGHSSYNTSLVALEFDWHSDTGGRTNTNTATNAIPTATTTRTALRCTCPYQARVHMALTLNRWGRRYFHGSRCSSNSNSSPLPLEPPGPESTTTTTATTTPTGITAWAWTRVLAKPSHAGSAHHATTRCRGPVQTLPTRRRSTTTATTRSTAEPTIWSVSLLYALVRARPELLVQHMAPPPPRMTRHKVATTNPLERTVPDTSLESPSPLAWCTPTSFHYQNDDDNDEDEEDGWFIEDDDEEHDSEPWNTTTPSPLGCSTPWPLSHSGSPAPSVGTPLGSTSSSSSPTKVSPGSERIVKKSRREEQAPQDNDNQANGTLPVPDLATPPGSFMAPRWD